MKKKYRLYRRNNGIFYLENTSTGKQRSLRTAERNKAEKLLFAENEAATTPALNLELAKVYVRASDAAARGGPTDNAEECYGSRNLK